MPVRTSSERGQILILTGLLLTILLGFAALLIDGGHGYVMRRQLQNAVDAAALSGANVVQTMDPKGCSATPGGDPYPEVVEAVLASLAVNLPSYDLSTVVVTCPAEWGNVGVNVQLTADIPTFFARVLGAGDRQTGATATAVHGRMDGGRYNIILLNEGPPQTNSWPQARNGCPSLQLNGGVSLTLEGSVHVNSACLESQGGAFATKGGSASLNLLPGAVFRVVGEYKRQALTMNPAPLEHQDPIGDPIAARVAPYPGQLASLTVRRPGPAKWVINGGTQVLQPGVYVGGIELRSHAVVYLKPGIYVMQGGGFQVGAQATVRSIPDHLNAATAESWATDCTQANCGVLLYNTGGSAMGAVSVSAGASVQLRAFNPDAPAPGLPGGYGANWEELRHLLFWQAAANAPSATYAQPAMTLNGGGSVFMAGTIYAPSALVRMGGTSGGGSGSDVDLTLQFITWDLEFSGNASFLFRYNSDTFVLPMEYGLVE